MVNFKDEIKFWLESAKEDEKSVDILTEKEIYSLACFHCQQAAEKTLKALCIKERRPAFTHSCIDLLKKLKDIGYKIDEEVFEAARRLDPHYIFARYPNGIYGSVKDYYDKKLAGEVKKWMKKIMKFVELNL